jgi:hypothetical protein
LAFLRTLYAFVFVGVLVPMGGSGRLRRDPLDVSLCGSGSLRPKTRPSAGQS